ncbi:unnamed protein product [Protopolystoma xenopodis]|uniref:Uncharacterized protein n=1 Tax=Protopolystoma xenopodis TaxID=117903 RepID=A0A448X923_9PLAT|nr:unnamed protein product [Protopolystoma xenopodis]
MMLRGMKQTAEAEALALSSGTAEDKTDRGRGGAYDLDDEDVESENQGAIEGNDLPDEAAGGTGLDGGGLRGGRSRALRLEQRFGLPDLREDEVHKQTLCLEAYQCALVQLKQDHLDRRQGLVVGMPAVQSRWAAWEALKRIVYHRQSQVNQYMEAIKQSELINKYHKLVGFRDYQ